MRHSNTVSVKFGSEHDKIFPNLQYEAVQNPTARWVFQFFSGIHLLIINQLCELVLNLNEYQLELLRLPRKNYEQLYSDSG
jgi:hypothetical protein